MALAEGASSFGFLSSLTHVVHPAHRVCPGQHVADRSIYMNLALLLWSFRILQRPEAPIHLGLTAKDVLVFHPKPFEVEFVPRVEEQRARELMT